MVLTIFVVWLALAVLVVLFFYCCSWVSNGARRELSDEEAEDLGFEEHAAAGPDANDPAKL